MALRARMAQSVIAVRSTAMPTRDVVLPPTTMP